MFVRGNLIFLLAATVSLSLLAGGVGSGCGENDETLYTDNPKSDASFDTSSPIEFSVEEGPFTRIYDPSSYPDDRPGGLWYINDHCFVYGPDNKWHLFGNLGDFAQILRPDRVDQHLEHATATSLSQYPWNREEYALSVDADSQESHLWAPHVILHEDLYYMFYCAGNPERDPTRYRIHLATSTDLYSWQRHPDNPMIVDGSYARDPFVMKIEDKWVMYYAATSNPTWGNYIVAYAISDNLISWETAPENVAFEDESYGTVGGPTESPTVVKRGEYYYLFIGPRGGYTNTCIYRSKDPLIFMAEDIVGQINAHAAEVVRDNQGNWHVSHCGWRQKGVYLAPLYWLD